jgi:hypothetical protein
VFNVCVRPYQTFNASMERSMNFYGTFGAFIKRSIEILEPLGNSTSNIRWRTIEWSMNLKIHQSLARRPNPINRTLTPSFHYSLVPWSSENVCECVRKSVWRKRRLLGFGGIHSSLTRSLVVICLLLLCLGSYYVIASVLFSNKLHHLRFVLV